MLQRQQWRRHPAATCKQECSHSDQRSASPDGTWGAGRASQSSEQPARVELRTCDTVFQVRSPWSQSDECSSYNRARFRECCPFREAKAPCSVPCAQLQRPFLHPGRLCSHQRNIAFIMTALSTAAACSLLPLLVARPTRAPRPQRPAQAAVHPRCRRSLRAAAAARPEDEVGRAEDSDRLCRRLRLPCRRSRVSAARLQMIVTVSCVQSAVFMHPAPNKKLNQYFASPASRSSRCRLPCSPRYHLRTSCWRRPPGWER